MLVGGRWMIASLSFVFVVLTAACTQPPAPPAQAPPPFQTVGTVAQVMEGVVFPSSEVVFNAAVWSNGVLEGGPKTEEDWHHVEDSALTVAEAGNLLMMAGRAKDREEWMTRALALNAAGAVAFKAAEARDVEALLEAGNQIYAACSSCHKQYRRAPTDD